jgi:long-chain acyl-CoA synthetase
MHSMLWPILRKAARYPLRVAIVDDQRCWRYLDLVVAAMNLRREIDRTCRTDHVAIVLPTSGAFAMTLLATWLGGRVAVPVNYLFAADQRQRVLDHCDADTLITAGPMLEHLDWSPQRLNVLKLDELKLGRPPLSKQAVPCRHTGAELAAILYTSGTAGDPKGVMLTHRNLRHNVDAAIAHAGLTRSNGFLGVLPQFHSFGLTALTLVPLRLAAKVTYSARFVPSRIVKLIADQRPDVFMAIPSMYHALLGVKKATVDDLRSVKLAISGAEPLPARTRDAFRERFGITILEGYGLTETSPIVSWAMPDMYREGTVGRLLPDVEVRIVDENTGNDRARGEEGHILVRGPNVMAGYYKQPELTREAIDDEGFFHTGDMGRLDEDDCLTITGRLKEMMIIGGENVFPREIEDVLADHPSVHAAGVVGRPDPSRGEVPVAYVELNEGQVFDESALRSWCREKLAGYKVPREVHHVDGLPRSPTGKILRRKLGEDADA